MAFKLGMNAKLYFHATAGAALASMTLVNNVKDVTIDLSTGEADVTTRGNSGFRANAATLKECSMTFQIQQEDSDSFLAAIQAAWLASTTIELCALTGAKDVAGSEGPKGSFAITNFSRSEPLEDAITYDVTAKLNAWDKWITDGAEVGS